MSYSKQGKEMYEPIVRLAERFGYSRKQIAKALEYLVDRGLIFRSAQKRSGSRSYSYSINWEKVEQFGPFLNKDGTPANGNKSYIGTKDTCEQKLHPNGNKGYIHMGTKVTSEWELSSHYNNIIDNNSDKRRDNVLSPFSFILLNN